MVNRARMQRSIAVAVAVLAGGCSKETVTEPSSGDAGGFVSDVHASRPSAGSANGGSGGLGEPGSAGAGGGAGGQEASAADAVAGQAGGRSIESCIVPVATGSPGLIDDLDDGDMWIPLNDGRRGDWIVSADGTGTQTPTAAPVECDESYLFTPQDGQACVRGGGFTSWGVYLILDLNWADCRSCPYDASAYHGVRFTLRGTVTAARMVFAITIAETVPTEYGGTCTTDCYNHYHIPLTPTAEPQTITVQFSELSQAAGWGMVVPWNPREMLALTWGVVDDSGSGSASFDFCVDDVEFI
jgi:hypothetical protein